MEKFSGLCEDTFRFFWELAFQNEISFFEVNRNRYETVVKKPLLLLAAELAETALEIDKSFQTRPSAVVSRIRRDTRYAPIDAPFRDHAYLSYRYPGMSLGESFVLYVEFLRDSYGYGMGIYSENAPFMAALRKRILERPDTFMTLINQPEFKNTFTLEGTDYKRPKVLDASSELMPWLNKRKLYCAHSSKQLKNTFDAAGLVEECKHGLLAMKPVYRFIMGLE